MTSLADAAAHARAMSTARHTPECPPRDRLPRWVNEHDDDLRIIGGHEGPPPCPGCVTDAERALWGRLADEMEAYMARDDEEGLFG